MLQNHSLQSIQIKYYAKYQNLDDASNRKKRIVMWFYGP